MFIFIALSLKVKANPTETTDKYVDLSHIDTNKLFLQLISMVNITNYYKRISLIHICYSAYYNIFNN